MRDERVLEKSSWISFDAAGRETLCGGHEGVGLTVKYLKREFRLPWREAVQHTHHDDKVDSDQ